MVDLPPNLAGQAAAAIVRQAEDLKRAETIAKRQAEEQKRRRQDEMRKANDRRGKS